MTEAVQYAIVATVPYAVVVAVSPAANTDSIAAIVINNLPAIIAAVATGVVAIMKINQLHTAVNSRLTELLAATRAQSRAEGVTEGAASEKAAALTERAARAEGMAAGGGGGIVQPSGKIEGTIEGVVAIDPSAPKAP